MRKNSVKTKNNTDNIGIKAILSVSYYSFRLITEIGVSLFNFHKVKTDTMDETIHSRNTKPDIYTSGDKKFTLYTPILFSIKVIIISVKNFDNIYPPKLPNITIGSILAIA